MATIITNQATINYRFGTSTATAVSNIASTIVNGNLEISKTSLSEEYSVGQNVTYVIALANNGSTTMNDITVEDDLGTYEFGGQEYTPLTYIGNAQLFIDGVFIRNIAPDVGDHDIIFSIDSLAVGANAQIIYQVQVNSFASGEAGATIVNTATADSDCDCPCNDNEVSASATITAEEFADVRIVKSICPNPAVCGDDLSFNFDIYNYGNIPATDVVLTDTFTPAISDIAVTLNGNAVDPSDYSYVNGTLTLPAATSDLNITVPAASFTRNANTGIISVIPGTVRIVVTGTI